LRAEVRCAIVIRGKGLYHLPGFNAHAKETDHGDEEEEEEGQEEEVILLCDVRLG
jgi:hypothetical protein